MTNCSWRWVPCSHQECPFMNGVIVALLSCLHWLSIYKWTVTESFRDNTIQIWPHGWVERIRRASRVAADSEKQDEWHPGEKVITRRQEDKEPWEGDGVIAVSPSVVVNLQLNGLSSNSDLLFPLFIPETVHERSIWTCSSMKERVVST